MFTRYFHIPILPISFYYPHVVNYIPMVGNNLIFPIHYHGQLYSPGWQLAGSYYSINKKTCRKNIDDLSPMVNINYSPFIPMRWRRCRRWSMPLAFAACWTALAEMPPGRETWWPWRFRTKNGELIRGENPLIYILMGCRVGYSKKYFYKIMFF